LKYYVYVLRSIPIRRLDEHNTRTGRWTSAFKPWEVVATEEFTTRKEACNREAFLKGRQGISERLQLFGRPRA